MERRITATELARGLSDILNRVRYRGEEFVIERNGQPVAVLSPPAGTRWPTMSALAEALRGIPLPGDGFADDLEAIQASQQPPELPPWPS
jgi:prevent-host-death family protein